MTSRFTVAEQSGDEGTVRSSNDNTQEKKAKPPPIDISAALESQLGMENDPKTPISAVPVTPNETMDGRKSKVRKIGHRRVNERGQITFKKIGTSQIMLSIQLGIGYAVGSLASKPERDLLMQDFTIVETTSFPPDGSNVTPAHHFSEFRFKTYAPLAFRYFRDLFGIRPDDFLLSLCHHPMRELSNPGASGSIFYLTDDDEFIIKTVQHKESEFLQKLLPGYYMNLNQNPRTLLPKFYGLYCYQCSGKNIRMVVMNNLLPSCIRLHEKYDLKGSTYKRKANKQERKKESPTFKDLDFIERHPDGILLESDNYNALIKTMQRDCRVLESFKIMDYSLLVGIHNIDVARKEKLEISKGDEEEDLDASYVQASNDKGKPKGLVHSKSINKQRLAAFSTAMESIQAENEMVGDDDFPPGGIPAKNSKGESLLLFLGIIDILQSFRFVKKLEHTFKSVFHDGDTVSVHRPGFYSQRFLQFMSKTVFKKMPSALKHTSSKRKGAGAKKTVDPKTPSSKIPSESGAQYDKAILPAPVSVQPMFSGEVCLGNKLITSIDAAHVSQKVTAIDNDSKTSVPLDKTDVVSLSQIILQTESTIDFDSEKSNVSTTDSSTLHTLTLSSPFSVEGSTPSCTEGTPSYTESSSSGDVACPTTPVKCINKSLDSLPPLVEAQVLESSEKNEDVLDNCDIPCEKQTRL